MEELSAGDSETRNYLRDVQYKSGSKLDSRIRLHTQFSTSDITLSDFAAGLLDWPDHARVLECGCGTGHFWTNNRVPKSLSVTLTDLSPGMVDEAVTRTRAKGFERVDGRECDVQSLPFRDNSYDIVVANHMLYHAAYPDQALSEIARVMTPKGQFMAATNGSGHMGLIRDCVSEVMIDEGENRYETFGIESGERLLRDQFARVSWHAFDNDLLVNDSSVVVAYALSVPPGESATQEQRAELTKAIGRRFVNNWARIRTRTGVFVCSEPRPR